MTLATAPTPVLEALRQELGPLFANEQQRRFLRSKAPEVLYSGAMGAGKSRILCEKAWQVALDYPGVTVALFRKVAASLPATTMRTFQRDVLDPTKIAGRNKQEGWYELHNGSRIYFLGLDPDPLTGVPSKVGSLDLGWAGVDEAVEVTESDWIMLIGRLRDPRIPWHQLAAATNPGPPDHWLKKRFTGSETREYLHATAQDNSFLPDDYKAAVAALPDNAVGRRLGRGEWAAAEGVIWMLPPEQVVDQPGPWKRVVAGVDWGFVHAFACEVVGVSGSGRLAVIDEVYERGATIDRLINALRYVRDTHHVQTFYADPSEPGYIAQCRQAGLPIEPAINDVLPGIDAVARAIARGLTITPSAKGLLSELPGYTWAPAKVGGFHERPIEINDDAADALRYALASIEPGLTDNPWAALSGQRAGGVA